MEKVQKRGQWSLPSYQAPWGGHFEMYMSWFLYLKMWPPNPMVKCFLPRIPAFFRLFGNKKLWGLKVRPSRASGKQYLSHQNCRHLSFHCKHKYRFGISKPQDGTSNHYINKKTYEVVNSVRQIGLAKQRSQRPTLSLDVLLLSLNTQVTIL